MLYPKCYVQNRIPVSDILPQLNVPIRYLNQQSFNADNVEALM